MCDTLRSHSLNDKSDSCKDLNRKANSLFLIFHAVNPFVKFNVSFYLCMVVLFGPFSSSSLKIIEVTLNKLESAP